jgi:hypothetical protein
MEASMRGFFISVVVSLLALPVQAQGYRRSDEAAAAAAFATIMGAIVDHATRPQRVYGPPPYPRRYYDDMLSPEELDELPPPPPAYRPFAAEPYRRFDPEQVPAPEARLPRPADPRLAPAPTPGPEARLPPPTQRLEKHNSAFDAVAVRWTSCLDQSERELVTSNTADVQTLANAILFRCAHFEEEARRAFMEDGMTYEQAGEMMNFHVSRARKLVVSDIQKKRAEAGITLPR